MFEVVFKKKSVLRQPLNWLEHVVGHFQVFAPIFAFKILNQLFKLWQPIEAVFKVVHQAGELSDVVVVQFQERALLGDDVSNFLRLGPMFDPVLKVLKEIFVESLKFSQIVENPTKIGVRDNRSLRFFSSFL